MMCMRGLDNSFYKGCERLMQRCHIEFIDIKHALQIYFELLRYTIYVISYFR